MSEGDRPISGLSQASSTVTISSVSMGTKQRSARPVRKVHNFGKRANSIKRDPNSPVIMRGWLYKQDSSGLKLWKRRWFVLSNYCLFYYRDSREEMVLGSILLPSYEIRTAFSKEKKNRRFVFKAEHPGMRTYYFSAETQLDMNSWIRAMNQSAAAECDYGSYNRRGLHSQSASTCTSFEDVTLTQNDYAKSTESLEIAHLSEAHDREASSSESLHVQDSQQGTPRLGRTSLCSSLNGGYSHIRKEQPDLSSLSSQTHGSPSPVIHPKLSSQPRSPSTSECPTPSSPSRTPQPSPLLSIRSSRSYSLPLTPAESPQVPDAHQSPPRARRKPPRAAATAQATSCEDLSSAASLRGLSRPNTPMGRVDIAPGEGPPNNPYATLSPTTRGRTLTPADRYDVFPSSEDPYVRRYTRSPHHSRARPVGEEGLTPSLARQLPPSRYADRGYLSPPAGTSRALVMSRLHGRLITPHSASSSYLHLPPLPPLPNRPTPGKRASLATTCRTLVRERSIHSPGGQRFESDTDALLTKLCGQDKVLRGLEEDTAQLQAEKERIEKALEVTRQRLEEFKGQDATVEKICYQQRQLQDELVQTRARLCDLALDSERAWEDYAALENDLQMVKGSLEHIRTVGHPQDQAAAQQDLWRIYDILAGLRSSPANHQALESRRSGVSPGTTPTLDPHLGPSHTPQQLCTGVEEFEPSPPPKSTLSFHESTTSHMAATVGQLDSPRAGNPPSPPASCRGQQGLSRQSDATRQPRYNSSGEPAETEKLRAKDVLGPDQGSNISKLCEDTEHSIIKVVSTEAVTSRRPRMSAQEQLDRMQRNQEAKRKSEAAQPNTLGHWRDSLKRGSSRPLPNAPPEPSPKEGVQTGGLKPPRCPPTPEWERQRVIQLSYALATEASQQRGKRIAGRTSSHSSLDDIPVSHESLNHHGLLGDSPSKEPELHGPALSEHDQTAARNSSCHLNSRTANQRPPHTTNQVPAASEAADWPLSLLPKEAGWLKPKTLQLASHLLEPANEELPPANGPPWAAPLPQPTSQHLSISRTTNWASEQSLGGGQGTANGRCFSWRGESQSRQVVACLGETARPVRVTLVKSSF